MNAIPATKARIFAFAATSPKAQRTEAASIRPKEQKKNQAELITASGKEKKKEYKVFKIMRAEWMSDLSQQ